MALYAELAEQSAEYAALRRRLAELKRELGVSRRAIQAGLEWTDALRKDYERIGPSQAAPRLRAHG